MDEHVQMRQESIRERKLLRSIEPMSALCDVCSAPPERNVHPATLVPAAHPPLPSGPATPPPLPKPPLPNRANAEEEEHHPASQQSLERGYDPTQPVSSLSSSHRQPAS
uniref:Uncharacterized protein n=1 Tax=Anopheles atroparvus TaxID=41427 RepID=A0A182IR61_ANOAO